MLDACGGLIDSPNGTITSPSFPDLYPSNKHCIWEIFAPPQYRITLNFTHFDLEGNNVSWIPKTNKKNYQTAKLLGLITNDWSRLAFNKFLPNSIRLYERYIN